MCYILTIIFKFLKKPYRKYIESTPCKKNLTSFKEMMSSIIGIYWLYKNKENENGVIARRNQALQHKVILR